MKRLLLPIFLKIAKSLGIDVIQNRIDEISAVLTKVDDAIVIAQFSEERANDYSNALSHTLTQQIIKVQTDLVHHIDQKELRTTQQLDQFEKLLVELRANIDALRRSKTSPLQSKMPSSTDGTVVNSDIDEILYLALEERFRGERDIVAERQITYLQYLGNSISTTTPLLDLGCGRGEWLRVLQSHGIPAVGLDGNSICVAECTEVGLSVQQGDLLSFLKNSADESFGAVTLFQVLEHLPFSILVETIREIRRVLVKDGVLIAEIPNSKNLRVGAGTFWIDPTHQRPLFPDVLMFLAEQVGFRQVDGIYVNQLGPHYDLTGLPDGARNALASVLDAVDGPGDFALIAKS